MHLIVMLGSGYILCVQVWCCVSAVDTTWLFIVIHIFNPRHACAARVTVVVCVCVCVCVCVSVCLSVCLSVCSVKSNLTSGESVRPEYTVMYSAGNGCPKICGIFSESHKYGLPFSCGNRVCAWHRGFCTLVHSLFLFGCYAIPVYLPFCFPHFIFKFHFTFPIFCFVYMYAHEKLP